MAWRVKNWNETYENHYSRKLKKLDWYHEPSVNDTYSYAALVALPDGPAIYGVWAMLKKIAAGAAYPNRGCLLKGQGQPHTIRTLSILTRMPELLIEKAIEALMDPEIGWLEEVDMGDGEQVKSKNQSGSKPETPKDEPIYLDEVAERICERHPKAKTMSVQACGRLLEKIIEGAADPAKFLKHIDAHHAWRVANEWEECEPRFVKSLAKWLAEDPMAPIPDGPARKEEPDYVERF